ncbi:nuclear transport factor 2 family protein [Pseudomonas syringae]|nr:nuclear transport factor 2 family protein [Pseudomonas syringae]MBD8572939.1 nuclear transport factor 2 family protein [Pseudomonas syringae]MBD8790713.1 nuclear transport factor 2 family protein [Pseudomonas syringae]MBD8798951.1 nuclear transport factor 2 family protein [Pseudomonas syringae]MBD8809778.1 nuclear transport factor 2 family protein [Pseudomonas syringae]
MDALTQHLKETIQAADRAITSERFDDLMTFYTGDARLVVKPGLTVTGKDNIRRAFVAIAEHFNHSIVVTQGKMQVIPAGDTALVIMETLLQATDTSGAKTEITRRATYVFRHIEQQWLCAVDNSYGTTLLDEAFELP